MLLQGIIALVVGITAGIKIYFQRIRTFFERIFCRRSKANGNAKSIK